MPSPLPRHPSASLLIPVGGAQTHRTLPRARSRQRRFRKVSRGRVTASRHAWEVRAGRHKQADISRLRRDDEVKDVVGKLKRV